MTNETLNEKIERLQAELNALKNKQPETRKAYPHGFIAYIRKYNPGFEKETRDFSVALAAWKAAKEHAKNKHAFDEPPEGYNSWAAFHQAQSIKERAKRDEAFYQSLVRRANHARKFMQTQN